MLPVYKLDMIDNQKENWTKWWCGIERWCKQLQYSPEESAFVVKPAITHGGIDVTIQESLSDAVKQARALLDEEKAMCSIIEPLLDQEKAVQFSVCVLDTKGEMMQSFVSFDNCWNSDWKGN